MIVTEPRIREYKFKGEVPAIEGRVNLVKPVSLNTTWFGAYSTNEKGKVTAYFEGNLEHVPVTWPSNLVGAYSCREVLGDFTDQDLRLTEIVESKKKDPKFAIAEANKKDLELAMSYCFEQYLKLHLSS